VHGSAKVAMTGVYILTAALQCDPGDVGTSLIRSVFDRGQNVRILPCNVKKSQWEDGKTMHVIFVLEVRDTVLASRAG
jgi:hypothetical protein